MKRAKFLSIAIILYSCVLVSQERPSFGTLFNLDMGLKIGVGLYPSAGMSFNLSSRGSGANIAVAGTIIELENCIRPELIWDYECIGAGIAYHKKIISIGLAYMWQRERNFDGAKILIGLNPF